MNKKFLIAIIILAAFLRFYKLAAFPVSLYWDEVAIGYNAFSIAQTGYDEYGRKFPLLFQSFNDYKLPGYIYTDALFVKAFGLSEFWVRFPSAFFGTFAVLLIYLLNRKIFNNSIAFASAFLLSISPWHLQFSRAAFEANAALTIVLLGVVLIFYGFKNKLSAVLSIPILFSSIYFYLSPRIFIPLILLVLAVLYKKELAKNIRLYAVGLIFAVIISVPILVQFFTPHGLKRVNEVSLFSDNTIIEPYVEARQSSKIPFSMVFLNRRIPLTLEILHSYFSHFSPGFLFFGDDPNPRQKSAFAGNLYLIEIPFLLVGLWILLKQSDVKSKLFVIAWLLIAPIPAGLTKEFPHSLRALLMIPSIVTISGIGLVSIFKLRFMKLLIPAVLVVSVISYLFSYFLVSPRLYSTAWAYGYKQTISETSKLEGSYDRIIFTGSYWKPYIFYLFYNKINPRTYFQNPNQEVIGKYRFGVAAWDNGKNLDENLVDSLMSGKTLLIISPQELVNFKDSKRFTNIKTIYDYSNKNIIFYIGNWQ